MSSVLLSIVINAIAVVMWAGSAALVWRRNQRARRPDKVQFWCNVTLACNSMLLLGSLWLGTAAQRVTVWIAGTVLASVIAVSVVHFRRSGLRISVTIRRVSLSPKSGQRS